MSFKATKPGNAAPDIKISSPMKNSSTDNETSIMYVFITIRIISIIRMSKLRI